MMGVLVKTVILCACVRAALYATAASAALTDLGQINPTDYRSVDPTPTSTSGTNVTTGQGSPLGGWDPYGLADTTHQWLDIGNNGTATYTFSEPVLSIEFIWGSPNVGNTVTTSDGQTYTDVDLENAASNAGLTVANTKDPGYLVELTGDFSSITFSSPNNGNFEIGIVSVTLDPPGETGGVPELSTWAMMGVGFAGLAFAGARARRPSRALA